MQEVEAIESEVRRMQSELDEIKSLLLSPETLPKPKEEKLKVGPQCFIRHPLNGMTVLKDKDLFSGSNCKIFYFKNIMCQNECTFSKCFSSVYRFLERGSSP